jgi:hypothetical protein
MIMSFKNILSSLGFVFNFLSCTSVKERLAAEARIYLKVKQKYADTFVTRN